MLGTWVGDPVGPKGLHEGSIGRQCWELPCEDAGSGGLEGSALTTLQAEEGLYAKEG